MTSLSNPMWAPGKSLETLEREVIEFAYKYYRVKIATANALGISVRTLDAKLEKYAKSSDVETERREKAKVDRIDYLRRARGQAAPVEVAVVPIKANSRG